MRDGQISLAFSLAAAQLLSVPICICSFHSDPMSLSAQLPPPSGSAPETGTWTRRSWTPTASLQDMRQMNSDGKRTPAFSAFSSLARVHSRETEAWHTGCPHCKERLPREPSGEPRPSSPHLQTRCSPDVVKLTSSAFQTHEKEPQEQLEQQP